MNIIDHAVGSSLLYKAQSKTGPEVDRLLDLAGDKLSQALVTTPDNYASLMQYGKVLLERANRRPMDEREQVCLPAQFRIGMLPERLSRCHLLTPLTAAARGRREGRSCHQDESRQRRSVLHVCYHSRYVVLC